MRKSPVLCTGDFLCQFDRIISHKVSKLTILQMGDFCICIKEKYYEFLDTVMDTN